MKNLFRGIVLAYKKWRNPLREVSNPGHPEETALARIPEGRYPGDHIQVVPVRPSTGDLAREYVRGEFERLIRQAEYENIRVPLIEVARPDDESNTYRWQWDWPGKAGREWQSVGLTVQHEGMLRVIAGTNQSDPVFLTIVAHRTTPIEINISSLLYADASSPVSVWVISPLPFQVTRVSANVRLSTETVKKIREQIAEETGVLASIPAPGSAAGHSFYSKFPEYLP